MEKIYKIQYFDKNLEGIILDEGQIINAPFTKVGDEITILEKQINPNEHFVKKFSFVKQNNHNTAICQYFSICGGCKLQQLYFDEYREQKIKLLHDALIKSGISYDKSIVFLHKFEQPKQIRRRVEFSVLGKKIGFKKYKSNDVVKINHCPLLSDLINEFLLILTEVVAKHHNLLDLYEIAIVDIDGKLDVLLCSKKNLNGDIIKALVHLSNHLNVVKISWFSAKTSKIEPIIIKEEIYLHYANHKIKYHSGDFIQASSWAEGVLQTLINQYIAKLNIGQLLDLFCGYGGYSFNVESANPNLTKIVGVDVSKNAIAEINKINHPKIKAELRDIFKNPLPQEVLNLYDLIIINPPRAGALAQIRQMVNSSTKYIVLVYCSISSLCRDLAVLNKDNKYEILEISIIDQFIFTHHVEILVFARQK